MKQNVYTVKELKPGVWRIEEANLGTVYAVRGSERGLLIDTGTGVGDLRGLVTELLGVPYDVVLTHGHGDHAGGTHQFERFFVHKNDVKMALSSNLESRKNYAQNIMDTYPESKGVFDPDEMTVENPHPEAIPFTDGKVFDLGGKAIEVFACPGHTPGSVDLLDRADGVLFSGDNHQHLELIMMPGEDRKKVVAKWLRGVRKAAKLKKEGVFDMMCGGHEELESDLLSDLIACGEGILAGKIRPRYQKIHIFEAPFASFGRVNLMYLGRGRAYRYEEMRPDQILAEIERTGVAYLPIGPLEWHGPAMPFGTDPLTAAAVAEGAVKRTGGVLLPTLYFGTERARTPDILRNIGFKGDEYIVGQDFPKNTLPSMYAREEVFAAVVSEYLRMLEKQGFRLAVIVNGHGADGQIASLDRLTRQFNGESGTMKVIVPDFFRPLNRADRVNMGHATVLETSLMMHLTASVDLEKLPPKEIPLKNTDWGITDGDTYIGRANAEGTVRSDPRDSTAERGKRYLDQAIDMMTSAVKAAVETL
ncbi:MAG: creatininase family protein [Clostridia bacterium]|nr:creatininase family protein [Clostridia bacterium]